MLILCFFWRPHTVSQFKSSNQKKNHSVYFYFLPDRHFVETNDSINNPRCLCSLHQRLYGTCAFESLLMMPSFGFWVCNIHSVLLAPSLWQFGKNVWVISTQESVCSGDSGSSQSTACAWKFVHFLYLYKYHVNMIRIFTQVLKVDNNIYLVIYYWGILSNNTYLLIWRWR